MMRSRWSLGALIVLGLVASPAEAGEKVLRLKNGRTVKGEIVEETRDAYIVKTAGGKTTVQKALVQKIEDPPPPTKPFLNPEPKREEPAAPGRPDASPVATPTPAARPAPTTPLPAVSKEALASEAEIAATRKALRELPAIDPEREEETTAARQKAYDEIKAKAPLGALVAIAAESENEGIAVPPERKLAQELVVAAGEKARPFLARALLRHDHEKGLPVEVLAALERLGDDAQGTVEAALSAKSTEALAKNFDGAAYAAVLEKIGTRRVLPAIYGYVLNPDYRFYVPAHVKAAKAILGRESDPDAALQALADKLDPAKLPPLYMLQHAIEILGASRGAHVDKLRKLWFALEAMTQTGDEDEFQTYHKASLKAAANAYATIGTREAVDHLVRILEGAQGEERRLIALEALGQLRRSESGPRPELVAVVVEDMANPSRTDAERAAYLKALAGMTGQRLGSNVEAWRRYIQELEQQGR